MRRAYIAGPMTGLPHLNFDAFFVAESQLIYRQWRVINPAQMDCDLYGYPRQDGYTHLSINKKDFIWRDLRAIMTLSPAYGDALVMLPGWQNSVGAKTERHIAKWIGLSVLTLEEALA